MKVYEKINAVQRALAKEGITKDRRNDQQGYKFRGIDDVYNALAPLLAENGLCILPSFTERACEVRKSSKGGDLFYVTVSGDFDFVAAEDGSKHTIRTFGEAMDSADKATNKAMSAAYKYAAFQAFAIPTEGDNDADATTPPPSKRQEKQPTAEQNATATAPTDRAKQVLVLAKSMPFDTVDVSDMFKTLGIKKFAELPDEQQQHHLDDMKARVQLFHEMIDAYRADAPVGEEPDNATLVDQVMAYIQQRAEKSEGKPLRFPASAWSKWAYDLKETLFNERSKE